MTAFARPLVGSFLACALATLAGCARRTPEPIPPKVPVVTVAHPLQWTVTDYEDFTGRTEPVRMVELKSRVTGYLTKVYFTDGDDVVSGEPLFEIDQRVYKAEFDRAWAARLKAERHYRTASLNFSRAEASYSKNLIGKEAYDAAKGELDEAEADVASAVAALELAEANLDFTRIAAPFAGRLSRRMVDPGNLVRADETLLTTIVALDPMYATFDIDERTVIRLRELIRRKELVSSREAARYVQIGFAGDDAFPLQGRIVFRDNQIDANTGTLRVRALFNNPQIERQPRYMVSPGQFVRVRLPIGNPRPALLVPERSLGVDQGQKYLYVVDAEQRIERRDVVVGQQFGPYRVIENDRMRPDQRLTVEDRVVTEGLLRVRPRMEVKAEFDKRPPDYSALPPPPVPEPVEVAPAPRPVGE
jgi:RND family efflux transporter MFP subunit